MAKIPEIVVNSAILNSAIHFRVCDIAVKVNFRTAKFVVYNYLPCYGTAFKMYI